MEAKFTKSLLAAATAGLMAGALSACGGTTPEAESPTASPSESEPSKGATHDHSASPAESAAEGKSCCKGLNECKGKGGCNAHCPQ